MQDLFRFAEPRFHGEQEFAKFPCLTRLGILLNPLRQEARTSFFLSDERARSLLKCLAKERQDLCLSEPASSEVEARYRT